VALASASSNIAFLLLSLTTTVILVTMLVVVVRARKGLERIERTTRNVASGGADRETERRYLAANWSLVERAARQSGMTEDELADVKRKLFGDVVPGA
jgi:hypothetical protein